MKDAISSYWSAPGFNVTVTQGSENKITITPGKSRSYVVGGNSGAWGADNDPWVAAHEAGHLMNLPDMYKDIGDRSVAIPGAEGSMMGEYGGIVTGDERRGAAASCGCGQ